MKKIIPPFILACILALAFNQRALAVSKEWSYGLPEVNPFQVVADGTGGVALAYLEPLSQTTLVVWLDSKGQKVYQRSLPGSFTTSILGVNNRALVIEIENENIVVVDKHGGESIVPNVAGQLPNSTPNLLTDQNGFFAVELSDGRPTALVRYSY